MIEEIQKLLFPRTLKCVYKKDVLEYALKHNHRYGLCYSLGKAMTHYHIKCFYVEDYFPLFNFNNALQFSAKADQYWWPRGKWNTGRKDFLKWLIEKYKDDKTNLR